MAVLLEYGVGSLARQVADSSLLNSTWATMSTLSCMLASSDRIKSSNDGVTCMNYEERQNILPWFTGFKKKKKKFWCWAWTTTNENQEELVFVLIGRE